MGTAGAVADALQVVAGSLWSKVGSKREALYPGIKGGIIDAKLAVQGAHRIAAEYAHGMHRISGNAQGGAGGGVVFLLANAEPSPTGEDVENLLIIPVAMRGQAPLPGIVKARYPQHLHATGEGMIAFSSLTHVASIALRSPLQGLVRSIQRNAVYSEAVFSVCGVRIHPRRAH